MEFFIRNLRIINHMKRIHTYITHSSVDILGVLVKNIIKTSIAFMSLTLSAGSFATDIDASVERGRYIAFAGDCAACHNAENGKGDKFAGGYAFPTPFGVVYSTNITPDKEHGIGNYSYDDFVKVMREGIAPTGNLYPAMPFTSFHIVTDNDMKDLWSYMQAVPASDTPNIENTMIFPANIRFGLKSWNLLFLDSKPFAVNKEKSAEWNRGAYLVEGLAHCGECHTPRNIAMAMNTDKPLMGGALGSINAPNITPLELRKEGWTRSSLVDLFHQGHSAQGIVSSQMLEAVSNSFSHLTIDDLDAVATYLLDDADTSPAQREVTAKLTNLEEKDGKGLFTSNCAGCHGLAGEGSPVAPALNTNATIRATDPSNMIIFILKGIEKSEITLLPMPGHNQMLDNDQIASLSNYMRLTWGNNEKVDAELVDEIRQSLLDSGDIIAAKE